MFSKLPFKLHFASKAMEHPHVFVMMAMKEMGLLVLVSITFLSEK